jgi:hypothetical protein
MDMNRKRVWPLALSVTFRGLNEDSTGLLLAKIALAFLQDLNNVGKQDTGFLRLSCTAVSVSPRASTTFGPFPGARPSG